MSSRWARLLGAALLAGSCTAVREDVDAGDDAPPWSPPPPPLPTDQPDGLDNNHNGVVDEGVNLPRYACADPDRCTCAAQYLRCGDECLASIDRGARCGDACVLLASDNANCGACGRACDEGDQCSAGVCSCGAWLTARCGGACIDVSSDTQNCGDCGHACPISGLCTRGLCHCPSGFVGSGNRCYPNGGAGLFCEPACPRGTHCSHNTCLCDTTPCNGACLDYASDARNCGSCGNACAVGASCVDGQCVCPASQVRCGASCVDPRSNRAHCGACGRACADGYGCDDGTCRPRLGAPAAGERIGARRPVLRWPSGRGVADVCADRACARVLESVAGGLTGAAALTRPLAPGVYFWRVRAEGAAPVSSPAASFRVDRRDTPRPGLLPPAPDLNGDGLADVVAATEAELVAFIGASSGGPMRAGERISFAAGSPAVSLRLAGDQTGDGIGDLIVSRGFESDLIVGAAASTTLMRRALPAGTDLLWPIFDVNGDALGDSVVLSPGATAVYGDDVARPSSVTLGGLETGSFTVASLGDVNGDGYRDIALGTVGASPPSVTVHLGSATGLDRVLPVDLGAVAGALDPRVRSAGDVNGDGFADLLVELGAARVSLYLGGPSAVTLHRTLLAPAGASIVAGAAGDVDGDGYGDLAVVPLRRGELWWYRGGAAGLWASYVPLADPRWADVDAIGAPRDLDGDGFDDLVLGAPPRGAVYVLHGAMSDPLTRVDALVVSAAPTPTLRVL